jgi:hypothetical protein
MRKMVLIMVALAALFAGSALAAVHTLGGSGATGNTIPFWPTYGGMRFQTIWNWSEIGEAGPVSKLEWYVYSGGITTAGTFNNCKIMLCNTTVSTVTADYTANYGGNTPVTIIDGTYNIPVLAGSQYYTIIEPTTFNLTSGSNLLIEVSWVTASGYRDDFTYTTSGGPGRLYSSNPTATSGTVGSGYWQNGRVTIGYTGVAPASLGRVKATFKD